MYSGYKFCLQLEAGLVFWLSLLSVGKGKKLEKLSLVLETMSLGSLVSAKQKLVDLKKKMCILVAEGVWGCIQEHLFFHTFPSPLDLSLPWPCPVSLLVEKQFMCGFVCVCLCLSLRVFL